MNGEWIIIMDGGKDWYFHLPRIINYYMPDGTPIRAHVADI